MEREACVCDHGYERSDLCAEIIIIIIIRLGFYLKSKIGLISDFKNPEFRSHKRCGKDGTPNCG